MIGTATIDPVRGTLEEFARQVPDGQPIVMINLLRYREWAALEGERLTGRQCYERYAQAILPILIAVGGRLVWRGQPRCSVIGPEGERWDDAVLVAYPSRSDFERMVTKPEYQARAALRTAALEDSRLIATTAPQHIGRVAWWLLKLSVRARGGWHRSG